MKKFDRKKTQLCLKALRDAALCYMNLPRHISNHVFGEKHTSRHRMISGVVVIVIGTLMMCIESSHAAHIVGEAIGASFHGIGLHPVIEHLSKSKETIINSQSNQSTN